MKWLHPGAWAAWAVAAGVAALLLRNPLYLVLIALAAGLVWAAQRQGSQRTLLSGRGLARLGATILVFSTGLNMLFSHSGYTALWRLPPTLPYIGGPVTLEAALYGLTTGLSILAVLIVVMAFNAAVEPAELLRYLPGFLNSAGLVATIALTFAPQTQRALSEIREAQQVRGHRPRGLRDLPPLVVPLITSGLENAVGLAEAMAARGFGQSAASASATAQALRIRAGLSLSLLGLLAGMFLYGFDPSRLVPAVGLSAISGLALLGLLWWSGRGNRRSRYRNRPWRREDTFVAGLSGVLLIGLVAAYWMDPVQAVYDPYPRVTPPPFMPALGAMLLLLTVPAWMVAYSSRNEERGDKVGE